jgi:hypothetical protein
LKISALGGGSGRNITFSTDKNLNAGRRIGGFCPVDVLHMNLFVALHNMVILNVSYAFFAGVNRVIKKTALKPPFSEFQLT